MGMMGLWDYGINQLDGFLWFMKINCPIQVYIVHYWVCWGDLGCASLVPTNSSQSVSGCNYPLANKGRTINVHLWFGDQRTQHCHFEVLKLGWIDPAGMM